MTQESNGAEKTITAEMPGNECPHCKAQRIVSTADFVRFVCGYKVYLKGEGEGEERKLHWEGLNAHCEGEKGLTDEEGTPVGPPIPSEDEGAD